MLLNLVNLVQPQHVVGFIKQHNANFKYRFEIHIHVHIHNSWYSKYIYKTPHLTVNYDLLK